MSGAPLTSRSQWVESEAQGTDYAGTSTSALSSYPRPVSAPRGRTNAQEDSGPDIIPEGDDENGRPGGGSGGVTKLSAAFLEYLEMMR